MCWKIFTLFYVIKNYISICESNMLPYWDSYILRFITQPQIILNPFKDFKWFSDYSAKLRWNPETVYVIELISVSVTAESSKCPHASFGEIIFNIYIELW